MLLEAGSLQELVEQLWQLTFGPEPSIEEWMHASAHRALLWNGSHIRVNSPQNHVQDLIAYGVVEALEG